MYPNAPIEFTEEHQAEIDQWRAKYEEVKGMLCRVLSYSECEALMEENESDISDWYYEWFKGQLKEKKDGND